MTSSLVPVNGRHLPHGFSDEVVQRSLELILESGSIHLAQLQLEQELRAQDKDVVVPAWSTLCEWARAHEDVISHVHRDRKRDLMALGFDACMVSGQRMLKALPELSDSQVAVPHGIVWDKQIALLKDGSAPQTAIQINITDSKGTSIDEV